MGISHFNFLAVAKISEFPFQTLERWEGGLSADPYDLAIKNDPVTKDAYQRTGYHTNRGVTYRAYYDWALDMGKEPSTAEFLDMPDNVWQGVFRWGYWNPIQADSINSQAVAIYLADFAWGSGPGTAIKHVQLALNRIGHNLVVDGVMGPLTLGAINNTDEELLLSTLHRVRGEFLNGIITRIPSQERFRTGWFGRIDSFFAEAKKKFLPKL